MAVHRHEMDGAVLWTAALNGERVQYVSDDPALVLVERGIADGQRVGVELVDEAGKRRAFAVRQA